MKAAVFPKAQNSASRGFDGERITLDEPSVVELEIGPEEIAQYDRVGNDLVLVLKDGTRLVIEAFFVETAEGRNDLVLQDANGVTWWAQYGEEWTGFDIAEINEGAIAPIIPQGGMAGLGLLAGGAALAAGSLGSSDGFVANASPEGPDQAIETPEDTPFSGKVTATDEDGDDLSFTLKDGPGNGTVTVTPEGDYVYTPNPDYNGDDSFTVTVDDGKGGTSTITVDVTVTPANDAPVGPDQAIETPEDTPISGTVTATDVDGDDLSFTLEDGPSNGTVTVTPDGDYVYTPNPDYNGDDRFTVTVDDGKGGTSTITVDVTVTPANDDATITGDAIGETTEAGGIDNGTAGSPDASGTLTVTDIDEGEAVFREPSSLDGIYGTFSFDAETGAWSYALDNDRPATEALTKGEKVTDELTVVSADGTASETIVINITGTNDVPEVTDDSRTVTEDVDADSGKLTTSGQVEIADVDAGESKFDLGSLTFTGGTALGDLKIDADGNWTYEIENSLAEVQSLAEDESFTESWTITSVDGTATSTITVTIKGTNGDPVISGNATGDVVEDGVQIATGQLTQTDEDSNNTHTWRIEGSSGDYGTLSVDDSTGQWTYVLDNGNADVQALGENETLTEKVTVRVSDNHGGFDEQVVSITITGTNDGPQIAPDGDTSGAVTEIDDGAPGENDTRHSQTGRLIMTDPDLTDRPDLSVSVLPGAATGYLGEFTFVEDADTGVIDWTFEVDDADLDALREGEVLVQTYEVTVIDPDGLTATETVSITIAGTNDQPDAQDDATLVAAGENAVLNVLNNDRDDDAGETATLKVTQVAGQAIDAGDTITLNDGHGTVSLDGNGTLTFVPGPNAPDYLVLPYTVSDGSGAGNATATANWTINSAHVSIVDDASRDGAATPDDVLSSVDDLTEVAISGHAAVGGSVSLVVTDGTNSVTVPASDITVESDGSYSVNVDLEGLVDGTLTVTADVEDAAGNTLETRNDILKDTVTTVTIDPVLVEDGVAPEITGTGEPGATVTLMVNGAPYTATVQPDNTWSVTLPGTLDTGKVELSASAVDIHGNTDTDTRNVTALEISDKVDGEIEDIVVSESGLPGGSDVVKGAETTSSTFELGAGTSQLGSIVIGGSLSGGALSGGTTVTLVDLQAASATPVDIGTKYGTLTITDFDATSGMISYSYTLTANTGDHSDSTANDIIRESIQIATVEDDGDIRVGHLVAGVQDDAPLPPEADRPMEVVEGGAVVGSANGGDNLLDNDKLGADGGRVNGFTYTDADGDPATIVLSEGESETVKTQYGTLTVGSDGTWSYTPDESLPHASPPSEDPLFDNFSYTTIDGDGDVSASSATQVITIADTAPEFGTPEDASIEEQYLAVGTNPDAGPTKVGDTLNLTKGKDDVEVKLTIDDLPSGLKSDGVDIRFVLSDDGHTLTADTGTDPDPVTDPVFIVTLTDPTSATPGYTFELLRPLDHNGATQMDLKFDVVVEDSDGDTDTASFIVAVMDDAPDETVTGKIDEDSDEPFTFNISADATNANSGIEQGGSTLVGTPVDGGTEYTTANGTVTISPDGKLSYLPAANFSGTEVFEVVTNDDGTPTSTAVTIEVAPVADEPDLEVGAADISTSEDTAVLLGLTAPVITDDGNPAGRNNPTAERIGPITLSGLPEGAILSWGGGSATVDATGSVTIALTDPQLTVEGTTASPDHLKMSAAEFNALEVLPPANSHQNFEVSYSVTSYEVDGDGDIREDATGTPLAGATSTETVMVYVDAVTDPVTLEFNGADAADVENAVVIDYDNAGAMPRADITLNEDKTVNLSEILTASFDDLDGSEARSITITNGSGADIVVNGTTVAANDDVTIDAPLLRTGTAGLPDINIGGTSDFSGDLDGITVTLNGQDTDDDGHWDGSSAVPGTTATKESDSVTLNLHVMPVADDVVVETAVGYEDTPIYFLAGVEVTDDSTVPGEGGNEVITEISFEVPAGWKDITPPSVWTGNPAEAPDTELVGSTYTITFNGGSQDDRETYLDGFTITPPNHDSTDVTITLNISTRDESVVNSAPENATVTVEHDLDVRVNPVAETVGTDTDGDGPDDLTMTKGFEYQNPGQEDTWFKLTNDDFKLAEDWNNQDSGEQTFARLTPELMYGDGSQADATGSLVRWNDGSDWQEVIFDGSPIDVPMDYLDTVEFRAAENFSGQFNIKVQAHTVDPDDDGTGVAAEATTGEAYLTNILIAPKADDVTLSLAARTQGVEDQGRDEGNDKGIPLAIRPLSSDPSEKFNIKIDNIPDGAVLKYDDKVVTVVNGSAQIDDFDPELGLFITPPLHSNKDFSLEVSAQSFDRLYDADGVLVIEDISAWTTPPLQMYIGVKGVADDADVSVPPATPSYVEADLDDNNDKVALKDLVSATSQDVDPDPDDQSETLTLQITGVPEGFGLTQGTLLTGPDKTGGDRVWVLKDTDIGTTDITVPENFAGKVDFQVLPVTTENDGDSNTADTATTVSFIVTPSPEATVTTAAEIVEDELQPINLGIVHQNGDTDEVLEDVRIRVSDTEGDFTLFIGAPGSEVALSAAGLTTVVVGGEDYYELSATQVAQLSAQGAPHLDRDLGGFDLFYRITDPGHGTVGAVTGDWTPGRFELTATPASDAPSLSIADNSFTVNNAGEQVTIHLNIQNPDDDGSERLVRVVLDNVPEGVTVDDGQLLGDGTWLLTYEGAAALKVEGAGGLDLPVTFTVGDVAAGLENASITVTVQTQDRGDVPGIDTEILEDSADWYLTTDFSSAGDGALPAFIQQWEYNDTHATEDESFRLSDMIDAQIVANTDSPNILTVTIGDLPTDAVVAGMVQTTIDGQTVWTASVTTDQGDNAAAVQAKLNALMESIRITAPENANVNNFGDLPFNATLTTAVAGGGISETRTIAPQVPIDPVTDEAEISIVLGADDTDGRVTESDDEIPLTITVTNPADGPDGSTVTGDLYLQITGSNGLGDGTLTQGGTTLTAEAVTGVAGIPDGTYYVIENVEMDGPQDIVFKPDSMEAGDVTVDAWIRNIETGAAAKTATGSATIPVELSNDGVTLLPPDGPMVGNEALTSDNDALVELDLKPTLNDGSEEIFTVLLSNLPDGFLLYTGTSAADASLAEMAINAGGSGGVNTWVLADDGASLPPYIGILPPKHWSGTLDDLELTVTSGEAALTETRVDVLPIDDVTVLPVANGLTLKGTNSFGLEGTIVSLNLNASMVDPEDASVTGASDESVETTTLEIKGLGEFASFYIGSTLIASDVSYDAASDTYTHTLSGLSQSDLDELGFIQAASALNDQDGGTGGIQIDITARTVENGDPLKPSGDDNTQLTINLREQLPTTGDDSLIWSGNAINGKDGEDTVHLRSGESLSGAELSAQLSNVEILDLGIGGTNSITDLTPEQVRDMTDENNHLTVRGSAQDTLSFSGDWTDNGDGTHTGTIGGTDVTLTLDGVTVGSPPSTFMAPMMMSFGMPGGMEEFGLASLDDSQVPQADTSEGLLPTLDDVLPTIDVGEDLTAGLPEETSGSSRSAEGDGGNLDWPMPGTALEDELQVGLPYEV
nr:VCBS domain-containing protein [uncultured Roseovarius sp.]